MGTVAQATAAYNRGDLKGALRIASEWRIGMDKKTRAALKDGYESFAHPEFYRQLGKDLAQLQSNAEQVLLGILVKE